MEPSVSRELQATWYHPKVAAAAGCLTLSRAQQAMWIRAGTAAPPAAVWPLGEDLLAAAVPLRHHLPTILGPLTLLEGGKELLAPIGPAGPDGTPAALALGLLGSEASRLAPVGASLTEGTEGG